MRPLKRPMFRTGGPIKEGVMNGLKDGGVATYMADATMMAGGGMPNMRGRVTGPGGYAGKTSMADKARAIYSHPYSQRGIAMAEGAGMFEIFKHLMGMKEGGIVNLANGGMPNKRGLVDGPGGYAGIDFRKKALKYVPGFEKVSSATRGSIPKIYQGIKDLYARRGTGFKPSLPKVPGTPGKDIVPFGTISGKVTQNVTRPLPKSIKDAFKYAGELAIANPKTTALVAPLVPGAALAKLPFGIADTAIESYLGAEPFGIVGGKEKYRGIKKSVSDFFKRDKEDDDDKVLTEEQKRIKALEQQIAAMNKKNNKGKPEPTEEDRLKRIYDLLGVKRAQSNAASKALIDMSRYIDEGGRDVISKKNLGSTISKGISAFDKRLDKADQLKEAAGLLLAKGEIAEMGDPLGKEAKRLNIKVAKEKLNPGVETMLMAAEQNAKGGTVSEAKISEAVRRGALNEGKELIEYISSDDIEDGNLTGSVTKIVDKLENKKPGYYQIGKSVVEIDDNFNITLRSGPAVIS